MDRPSATVVVDQTKQLPLFLQGTVVSGFGRGSKELGFPTANLEKTAFKDLSKDCLGVFYGYSQVEDEPVKQMVMSVGWNPYYSNEEKSVEVHVLHKYEHDFYGSYMKVIAVGFIRDMTTFNSLEDLIKAIENDIRTAKEELSKPHNLEFTQHAFWNKSKL